MGGTGTHTGATMAMRMRLPAGGEERGDLRAVEVLVDPLDAPVDHAAEDARRHGEGDTVAGGPSEDVLLDEPLVGALSTHDVVVPVADVLRHPQKDPEVVLGGLLRLVEVVPHDRIGRVDVSHGIDVAGLDGPEQAVSHLEGVVRAFAHRKNLEDGRRPGGRRRSPRTTHTGSTA